MTDLFVRVGTPAFLGLLALFTGLLTWNAREIVTRISSLESNFAAYKDYVVGRIQALDTKTSVIDTMLLMHIEQNKQKQ